ncbi:Mre11 DNA-binding presumed domain-containing protein [Chytridium lagenaria]|nr:Mre11 DNA-binding presumed domain-containing protein [Chytridium lagenaria]
MSDIPQNAKDLRGRILIATDNHLGYLEKDPVRGDDSFNSFEEILATAVERDVGYGFGGGCGSFHDNKPSRKCLHTTMSLLRKYSMGSRNCYLNFEVVNYQDPNLNISMPIFSIHGNHDDPSGVGREFMCPRYSQHSWIYQLLWQQRDVDDVKLTPILLQKGNVKLGLYGLGNIRDERLHRTFLKKKVAFLRPIDGADEVKHGATNYIPEEFLEDFLDIVVWGHEHECLVDLTENVSRGFYVTQPGSSVATSLCEGEGTTEQYSLESIPLKIYEIMLAKIPTLRLNDEKKIMKVESLIEKAHTQWLESHPEVDAEFPKPIVRLKVEYTGFSTINPQRFGQPFVDRVANVKDILQFYRRRAANADGGKSSRVGERSLTLPENLSKLHMNDLINEYLSQFNMSLLSENGINEALRLFVEKEDKDAIEE